MILTKDNSLAFLAIPRTASTSIHRALLPFADRTLPKEEFGKHLLPRNFYAKWSEHPDRQKASFPETFTVVRSPLQRLQSWYRFRQRDELENTDRSTRDVSFEDFVREHLSAKPAPFARFGPHGDQFRFCTNASGAIILNHIFDFERLDLVVDFLKEKGYDVTLPTVNETAKTQLEISSDLQEEHRAARSEEYALYDSVHEAGVRHFVDFEPA